MANQKNDRMPLLPVEKTQSRPRSPTRKQNPQPLGLKYQQPYNRFSLTFGIWNPNHQKNNRNFDKCIAHTKRVTFQCAKITSRTFKDPRTDGVRKQTEQQNEYQ